MTHIDITPVRNTSVNIRSSTRVSLKKGIQTLAKRKIHFSEQRLMRECLRIALRLWRGRGKVATRCRKYNARIGPYEIVPFYTTEAMRSAAWVRCHHSGISLSRLMDFAIAHYLPRVLESWLRYEYPERDRHDVAFWKQKYERRRHKEYFVISYFSITHQNDGRLLNYEEKTRIEPWPPPLTIAA